MKFGTGHTLNGIRDVEEDAEDWMKREGLEGNVKRTMRAIEVSKIRKLGNGMIERKRRIRRIWNSFNSQHIYKNRHVHELHSTAKWESHGFKEKQKGGHRAPFS